MAKRYIACPYCWGKIRDSAIKCMYCKKWLNTEKNPNYDVQDKNESKHVENINKVENRTTINKNEAPYTNNKSILWRILWFQAICLLWALVNIL